MKKLTKMQPRAVSKTRPMDGLFPRKSNMIGIFPVSEEGQDNSGKNICCRGGDAHHHPVPRITVQAVQYKILKSSHSDQWSMYSRSIFTQSSKFLIRFRPRTCHKQVIPGFMLNLRLCQNS